MSAESPAYRGKTVLDSPSSTRSLPPVTPGVGPDGNSAYIDPKARNQEPDDYFGANKARSNSPLLFKAVQQSSLRRTSLASQTGEDVDPRQAYPNLNLSGRLISASFVVPFNIGYHDDGTWELGPRKGTRAIFHHFAHLSSHESKWAHTLVGWTGEITSDAARNQYGAARSEEFKTLMKASAPVPVDGKPLPTPSEAADGITLSSKDRQNLERLLERHESGKMVPVWLADQSDDDADKYVFKDQRRWCRFAEKEIYPLFHYKQNDPSDGRAKRKAWADYYRMNKLFADRIMEIYSPGDVVVVHDYQLMLLPSLLRQRLPSMYVGYFLHIPFPSSELYRCLSPRKELLEGMLGAHMIGFQSFSYARHFSSCCKRILGFDSSSVGVDAYGAHVAVDVFPIGVDAPSILEAAFDSEVDKAMKGIRETYAGKKIIIGRDRLDAIRGVPQKLQAFEYLLKNYPQWTNKVVLIQITSAIDGNAEQEPVDKKYATMVSNLVSSINGEWGSVSDAPIRYFPQYLSRRDYFALLRCADLGLITSTRDGMNTTSLEYVLCQKDGHNPLILSEFSGTAGFLSDAILVNPWDHHSVAEAIDSALTMEKSKKDEMHQKSFNCVVENDIQAWSDRYMNKLLTNLSSFDQSFSTPVLDRSQVLAQYRAAKKRLFLFDYDGTLTPIVKDPQAALPSDKVLRTLKQLASEPNNSVWIISGRDQQFLDEWMGDISELGLSAEHGSFLRQPKSDEWENVAAGMDMAWREEAIKVFNQYTERTQGSFVEKKKIAVTWHYRLADPEYGDHQARLCKRELENSIGKKWDVEVMSGKANIEVRPRFVNKGEIAKRLVEGYGGSDDLGFVLCLGDDFTDEDMFRALRQSSLAPEKSFPVTVGASSKQTLAPWHLLEPADVISVLGLLNGNMDTSNVGAVSVVDGKAPEPKT